MSSFHAPSPPAPLLARGRLLTMTGPPITDGMVLIEGGRISYAGGAANAPRIPSGTRELDVGDGSVLPGLVDAHVHLALEGGRLGPEVRAIPPEELALEAGANAVRSLAHGVVAVRDLGAPGHTAIAVSQAVTGQRLLAAEVSAAGRLITVPDGHAALLGVEAQGASEMAVAARAQLAAGADGIKVVLTGGVLSEGVPGEPTYEVEELASAVGVAREYGAWVAVHAIGEAAVKRALRAGATTIEHGVRLDDEAIEMILTNGAILVPTLLALARIVERGRGGGIPAGLVDMAESIFADDGRPVESLRRAALAGVPIAAGTDAGSPFNPHGGVAEEVRLLVEKLGLSPESGLRAATIEAARCLRRDDLGRLAPGVPANVIVVDGDVVDDVRALTRLRAVVKSGRTVSSPTILPPR